MVVTVNNIQWAKNGTAIVNCNQNASDIIDTWLGWIVDITLSTKSNDNCIVIFWKFNGVGYYTVACMGFPTGRYPDAGVSVDVKYQEGSYTDLQAFPCTGLQACHQLGDQLP